MVIFYVFIIASVIIIAHKFYGLNGFLINARAHRPLHVHYKTPIVNHSTYYQALSSKDKAKFEKKVNHFILSKEFIPRNLEKVTDEMKALIAACAVQLTFGLPDISLKHFNKVLIYPNDYYSTISRKYHKGEVNPRLKTIVLSWHHFVEGFANPGDGMNLGLHEMAHALKLENIIENGDHHFFDITEYTKWLNLATIEIANLRNGNNSIFRQYASVNEDEFFAVCMEVYFERPHQLFEYKPELYKVISNLLRQDTIKLMHKK